MKPLISQHVSAWSRRVWRAAGLHQSRACLQTSGCRKPGWKALGSLGLEERQGNSQEIHGFFDGIGYFCIVGSLGVSEVMGVRLNHLFIDEFSMMNHPAMGMPPLMGKKTYGPAWKWTTYQIIMMCTDRLPSVYVKIAIENCHRNSKFSHWIMVNFP